MAFDTSKTYNGPVAADDALVVNTVNAAFFQYGTAAARPGFGNRGILYWATDTEVLSYDTGSAWVDLGALNALAQTITGIKTFASIPVLPGSDPTTDNQAARKLYVDTRIAITSGSYSGDNTVNRAIAHSLGRIPKFVFLATLYGASGTIGHVILGGNGVIFVTDLAASGERFAVTAPDATNFYVGNATSYEYSANDGYTIYWAAIG